MSSSGGHEHQVLLPHSLAVGAFSTIVEWYDFTLYLYFATVLSRVFFGGGAGSLLTTLAGFAIAYLISRRIKVDEVNDAFKAMEAGEVARSVVIFD